MGWSKKPSRFSDAVADEASKLMRKKVLGVLGSLTATSPVDTGLFKGNWQVSIGRPLTSTVKAKDKSGSIVLSRAKSKLRNYNDYKPVYITNNLPYAQRLNDGHSGQAPANFVEDAVLRND